MAALGTPGGVVSDEDHRLALAGLIAPQTSTTAVRTGVLAAPGSTALVTGTSATGTMTVAVAPFHAISTRGAADGIYVGTLAAATTVTIAAAPGSNSRIDTIYAKQNDSGSSISPDGSTTYVVDKVTGTAAASPTAPAVPTGGVELAQVRINTGTTATNGAGATITNTARQVVARGADIPVRSQAERDALTPFWPLLTVKRLDTGAIEMRNAANSAWVTIYSTPITPTRLTLATGWAHAADRPGVGNYDRLQVLQNGTEVRIRGTVANTVSVVSGTPSLVVAVGGIPAAARPPAGTAINRAGSVVFGAAAAAIARVDVYADGGIQITPGLSGGADLAWSFDLSYSTVSV